MLKNRNYTKSLHDLQVEFAQNWLKGQEALWRQPDLDEDIVEYQEEFENRFGQLYPKAEVYKAVQLIAKTTVSVFQSLKNTDITDVIKSAALLEPMLGSSLWHYTGKVAEAMALSKNLSWHKDAFFRLTSHFDKISAILKATDPRIIDAVQELIRADALGQDAASIIFSRTALELTLKSKISRKDLEKHFGPRLSAFEISDRIAFAHIMGILNDQNMKLAEQVRIRANQLTHEDVRLSKDSAGIVENAFAVIGVLLTNDAPCKWGETLCLVITHTHADNKYQQSLSC